MNIKLLEENTAILRKKEGKWIDKRLVLLTAAQFAARQQPIDMEAFKALSANIKKSGSMFSPLRTIHFPMAGLLMLQDGSEEERIAELHRKYYILRSAGFRSSPYTYIAAFLMGPSVQPERIKEMYHTMKKHHILLTSNEDYPAAAMMASRPESIQELAGASELYYHFFHKHGFWRGNDLQFLANILVANGLFQESTADAILQMKRKLEQSGIKVKSMHYPALGMMTLSGRAETCVPAVHELKKSPALKWNKDMAVILAAVFVSQEMIQSSAGLTAAVQAMIQSQQAVIAASTAGAIAASSISGE
ncbi:DUF4003 family protein [Domibacillus sp. DTU_2020_1001157_1_SI_ALB_TIR_016]|uniref:DUF4003 family protein n=1 Tax=Domibacillus sp. DTU_2020_1001157_1_SI_ALB_TIR_016 TaxID=3077789 RepID=UPI0028EFECF7|nr:DUF4003 family protein [Domibacillus sp. DTU_2020_1001157_1_SI_ALB_TIR_016]WNS81355.1 DUF4003 family protein [Domibacillus sp. DTU_2020_1001157_1_SI_ALB_TIR_016]